MTSSFSPHRSLLAVRCFFFATILFSSQVFAFSGLSLDAGYHHSVQKIKGDFISEKKVGLEWVPSGWVNSASTYHPIFFISSGQWEIAKQQLTSIGASAGYCRSKPNYQRLCLVSGLSSANKKSEKTNIFEIEMQFTRFIGPDLLTGLDLSFFQTKFKSTKGFLIGLVLGHKF